MLQSSKFLTGHSVDPHKKCHLSLKVDEAYYSVSILNAPEDKVIIHLILILNFKFYFL